MSSLRTRAVTVVSLALLSACGPQDLLLHEGEKTGEVESALRVCARGPTVTGIDVSEWQGTIDWDQASRGLAFAITRINDGHHLDPTFRRNWDAIKAHGLIRGAYQFYEPTVDPAWQAQVVIDAVGLLGPGDLPVTLDVEWTSGTPNAGAIGTWMRLVEAGTGKKPMIYTAVGYWNQYFHGEFGDHTLWVANYGVTCPNLPSSWSDWTFWQWGGSPIAGIGGNVDTNVFNGTIDQLRALAGGGGAGGDVGQPNVAVGVNADGRLEVFARGPKHQLLHSWQLAPNGGWSGWADLGGVLAGEPVVAKNQDGRLEVFAVGGDGAVWHQWQLAPNGGWSGWASLGGQVQRRIAVGTNADGRLEVFAIGGDSGLWHAWQWKPNGEWSWWVSLGGQALGPPTVAANADGRLEVFVRGGDAVAYHQWQTADGKWSGFWPMKGQFRSSLAVGQNADGRLEAFGVGTDGQVWHAWQGGPNGGWSDWWPMGGQVNADPAVGRNADGRLEVFVRGTDGRQWHAWQDPRGAAGWSGFWPQGDLPLLSSPSVATNADGRLETFMRGPFGGVFHVWQQAGAPGGWSGWAAIGG